MPSVPSGLSTQPESDRRDRASALDAASSAGATPRTTGKVHGADKSSVNAPTALLLDEGDLEPLEALLHAMNVRVVRKSGHEAKLPIARPTRLLVTSGSRTFDLPEFEDPSSAPEAKPLWVCIHHQDFLPLRERLREVGVTYLVQRALDRGSIQRFFAQLLHDGPERRRARRLSLGGKVRLRAGRFGEEATLLDLSAEACSFLVSQPILPGTLGRAVLPASLGGGEELKLEGRITRCQRNEPAGGHIVVMHHDHLTLHARNCLEALTEGERIGSRVTPLSETRTIEGTKASERRRSARRAYEVPVRPVGDGCDFGSDLLHGRDLSETGVRILGLPNITVGKTLKLAMYGGPKDAPFIVDATVVRDEGDQGIALTFHDRNPAQQKRLEDLCAALPEIDRLDAGTPGAGRVVISEILNENLER